MSCSLHSTLKKKNVTYLYCSKIKNKKVMGYISSMVYFKNAINV